uniref:Phorbol-ester/DAG-type domain-containing protein n=1 Tax=Steinernema glaseri TaxID=37863 RepID=A0A1I7YT96_9BILA
MACSPLSVDSTDLYRMFQDYLLVHTVPIDEFLDLQLQALDFQSEIVNLLQSHEQQRKSLALLEQKIKKMSGYKDQLGDAKSTISKLINENSGLRNELNDLRSRLMEQSRTLEEYRSFSTLVPLSGRPSMLAEPSLVEDDSDVFLKSYGSVVDQAYSAAKRVKERVLEGDLRLKRRRMSVNSVKDRHFKLKTPLQPIDDVGFADEEDKEETTLETPKQKPSSSRLRRSFSESRLVELTDEKAGDENQKVEGTPQGSAFSPRYGACSVDDLRSSENHDESGDILRRRHSFVSKRIFLRDVCDICAKVFRFGSNVLKCSDCRLTCHMLCRREAPVPCAPRNFGSSLKSDRRSVRPRLADFCPDFSPMVPHIVIHLAVHIERCHLTTPLLYEAAGEDKQVADLLAQFKNSRCVPVMDEFGGIVLSDCLKKFLSELRDPLIPLTSYAEFLQSAQNQERLVQLIEELPVPNRETLAFLCQHWIRVSEKRQANQMDLSKLASCLGPVVFGANLLPNSLSSTDDNKCCDAMKAMLQLPENTWTELSVVQNVVRGPCTPNQRTPLRSRSVRPSSVVRTPAGPSRITHTPLPPKWKN